MTATAHTCSLAWSSLARYISPVTIALQLSARQGGRRRLLLPLGLLLPQQQLYPMYLQHACGTRQACMPAYR